jgi:tRNA (guanine10-N2)-dimethyltransferase
MWFSILGRQPELSIAELEQHFGADSLRIVDNKIALFESDNVDINHLGGSLKIGNVLTSQSADLPIATISDFLLSSIPKSESKMNLGISWYGLEPTPNDALRYSLELKKLAKNLGHKLRIVPNKTAQLSTAQVLHNRLVQKTGIEFIIIRTKSDVIIGQTLAVQDIDAYRQRDYERPARDPKVGMLPPKLAQIMLSLAQTKPGDTVLDPFCGTGVILQEALLLGAQAYGSDISERMVKMSEENLLALAEHYRLDPKLIHLEVADARIRKWMPLISIIVSEIYLGPPLSRIPPPERLTQIQQEIDSLLIDFLENLSQQVESGIRLVLAIPAWKKDNKLTMLPTVDRLTKLGYTRVSFKHVDGNNLVYFRDNQVVARQLLVLIKD